MVLATVVKTAGSSCSRPGTRMIIPAGTAFGMVSGGCLETDLVKKAWWRTSDGGRRFPCVRLIGLQDVG
ncbi:XdhC family protein [Pseudomonas sp. NPDC088368]|uniref:XdhC family protein n=1 Tax=Pseudomonas sp. NPDC088368 TaxID=3364453 RepID=UPI00381E584D